jgi:HPt (histidine-containing phosphotransfer) domain-containing protein
MYASTTEAGNKVPLDLNRLVKQWDVKSSFVSKILDAFEREFGTDMGNLKKAFAGENPSQVAGIAHRLKGAAATIGAEAIREEAAELECMGHSGDLSLAPGCFRRLESEYNRYRSYRRKMELLSR